MNPAIAIRMVGADFLKLRKKRGTLIWALVLTLAPLLIFFIVKALQHSSSPAEHSPAGGVSGYTDALRVLAFFFGPLAAIMIGTDGGAGDLAAGVFRFAHADRAVDDGVGVKLGEAGSAGEDRRRRAAAPGQGCGDKREQRGAKHETQHSGIVPAGGRSSL